MAVVVSVFHKVNYSFSFFFFYIQDIVIFTPLGQFAHLYPVVGFIFVSNVTYQFFVMPCL